MIGRIRYLIFKGLNALFGKFRIFIILLGWFLVITGVIFLFDPERARRKLTGMGLRQAKIILISLALSLAMFISNLANKMSGILSLVLLIAGIAAIIRFYILFRKRFRDKISAWFARVSLKHLKTFAVIQIAIGIIMIVFNRRIFF